MLRGTPKKDRYLAAFLATVFLTKVVPLDGTGMVVTLVLLMLTANTLNRWNEIKHEVQQGLERMSEKMKSGT
jgi:hypothetical protein